MVTRIYLKGVNFPGLVFCVNADLTPAQAKVAAAIILLTWRKGMPPTVREVCAKLGRFVNTVIERIKVLARKGVIAASATPRGHRRARTFRVKGWWEEA